MAVGQLPDDDEWEVIDEGSGDDEFEIIEEPAPVQQPIQKPKPQLLGLDEPVKAEPTLWEKLDTPLTDLPSRVAKVGADKIDEPELNSSFPRLKGFAAGALQGAGDLFTRMTSPLELGMALASGGASIARRGGLSGLSRGLEAANMALSGAEALHGAGEVIRPDATFAEKGSGLLEAALGGVGARNSFKQLRKPVGGISKIAEAVPDKIPTSKIGTNLTTLDAPLEDIGISTDKGWVPENIKMAKATQPDMFAEAQKAASVSKPKIKVKYDESGTLVPDDTDSATSAFVESLKTKKPVPENLRISPDEEIPIPPEPPKIIHPKTGEVTQPGLNDYLGIPRAVQSAWDMSMPFRQGLGLIHTKGWRNSWEGMVKSFGSQKAFDGLKESILEKDLFKPRMTGVDKTGKTLYGKSFAEEAGLDLPGLVGKREENMGSALAEKIPVLGTGVKMSNRAADAFMLKLRTDVFEDLIRKNPAAKTDLTLARALADYVNNASGRGRLPFKLEHSAETLNNLFFSPRLMASRMQVLNPKNYLFTRPELRKEYLKSVAAIAGTWMTVAGLGKAAGAEVSLDPENSDFGKMKFGNTRIDPAGGFQQYLVLFSMLAKGGYDNVAGNKGRYQSSPFTTADSDVLNFARNKLAPNARITLSPWLNNKDRPFEVGDQSLRLITPIILQDLSEIVQDDPSMAWVMGPNFVGMGSNTYEKGKKPSRLLPESIFPRSSDFSFPRR